MGTMPVAIATGFAWPFIGDVVPGFIKTSHGAGALPEHGGEIISTGCLQHLAHRCFVIVAIPVICSFSVYYAS
jgi:hypothetical protein